MGRRCIIHIGHPKTATTYLQHCLHLNAEIFRQHGMWLPANFTPFEFQDLQRMSQQGLVISGNLAPLHELMINGPGDKEPAMYDYLFAPQDMPPGCDILLSSELFFYYVNALPRVVNRARREFRVEPEIVAYVQRQDKAAVQSYLQNVRAHRFAGGVVDFLLHDPNMRYCRYAATLDLIAAKIPGVPVHVRSFEKNFLRDGDILADFLALVGPQYDPAQFVRPGAVSNQGLTLEHYEVLRALTLLRCDGAHTYLAAQDVPIGAEDRSRVHAFYYRPGVRQFLQERYLPENAGLLARYMPNATSAERDYWCTLDPCEDAPEPDPARMDSLFLAALQQEPARLAAAPA